MLARVMLNSLWHRRTTLLLVISALALSVSLLLGVERVREETRERFFSTVSGVDLIVGAPSGPLNLLLYSVFRMGEPVANVSWSSVQALADHPQVEWVVPLSLGDSYQGFPVVATSLNYFEHYRYGNRQALTLAEGELFDGVFDVVLGSDVARQRQLSVGDEIIVGHGTGAVSLVEHDQMPFTVTGILASTGTPVDRSLHISLEAMTAIHLDWVAGTPIPGRSTSPDQAKEQDLTPRSVTAVMIGLKSRMAVFNVQRWVNNYRGEPLQAILPGVTLQRFWQLLGMVEQALKAISIAVLVVAILVMLAGLLTALNERRREIAILRALGARRWQIAFMLVAESAVLTLAGILVGVLLLQGVAIFIAPILQAQLGVSLTLLTPGQGELTWLAIIFVAGTLAGLWPAWRAYRQTLNESLTPRD